MYRIEMNDLCVINVTISIYPSIYPSIKGYCFPLEIEFPKAPSWASKAMASVTAFEGFQPEGWLPEQLGCSL